MLGEGVAGPTALAAALGFAAVIGLAAVASDHAEPPPAPRISLPEVPPPSPGVANPR